MISAAIVKRISDNVPSLAGKVYPESAPENIAYPFLVYRLDSVERYTDLSGTPAGCPVAQYRFAIFGTSRSQVETLSNSVGALFDGWRGMIDSQQILTSTFQNQESNEVFVEGSDIPVYSYSNTHSIQYKE